MSKKKLLYLSIFLQIVIVSLIYITFSHEFSVNLLNYYGSLLRKPGITNRTGSSGLTSIELAKLNDCTHKIPESTGEDYFEKYVVKSGDTLNSIAQNKLGSTSHISDIVNMNKHRYTTLSTNSPYVEVGWELLLPPADFITGKSLKVTRGKVHEITNSGVWRINYGYGILNYYPNNTTIIDDGLSKGDCVDILIEWPKGTVLKISLQD